MSKTISIIKNIRHVFIAQFLSLFLSFLLSLWLPKYLAVEEYGYWQIFLFYAGYTGILHFGLCDGVYLKYGGYDINDLNRNLLKGVFKLLIFMQLFFSLSLILLCCQLDGSNINRLYVFISVALYSFVYNVNNYLVFLFQATNRIKLYSNSCNIRSACIVISVVLLVLLGVDKFQYYVIAFILGHSMSLVYNMFNDKLFISAKVNISRSTFVELWENISIGINLMLANLTSMLIIGVGRIIIDNVWGVSTFAIVALSLSLTNFFLLFINQVSIVLFPSLRQSNDNQLKKMYVWGNTFLTILMPAILLLYYPISQILDIWLPHYVESIRMLILVIPICLFDGKMQMLYNTYLKVLRKEKVLFKINLTSFILSSILCFISGYIFNNLYVLIISIVITIVARCLFTGYYLAKKMEVKTYKMDSLEVVLVTLFICVFWFFSSTLSLLLYFSCYVAYVLVFRKRVCFAMSDMKKLLKR